MLELYTSIFIKKNTKNFAEVYRFGLKQEHYLET